MGGNSFNDMLHLHYEVNWINQISSFTFKSADFIYLFLTFKAKTHQENSDFCAFFLHQKAESVRFYIITNYRVCMLN